MAARRFPFILLWLLMALFVAVLLGGGHLLPDRVATHFNAAGEPNGWMSRKGALLTLGLTGLLLPLFIVGSAWSIRRLPPSLINLPHKDYWLAPERRDETSRWLSGFFAWIGCLSAAFFIALYLLIIAANRSPSPRLSSPAIYTLMAVFIGGIVFAIVKCFRHFGRVSPPSSSGQGI